MKTETTFYFKIIFLIGIIFLFVSLFLEWYQIDIFDLNNVLISSWNYTIFFEWKTEFLSGIFFNDIYRPVNLEVPMILNIIFIIVLMVSVYILLFKEINLSENILLQKRLSFIFLFLLTLTVYYIVVFPIMYLFPHNLYFPFITNFDLELQITQFHMIGSGYILQLVGFVMIFPYALHYSLVANELAKKDQIPEIRINQYIKHTQTPLDIDKYIAEELENFDEVQS